MLTPSVLTFLVNQKYNEDFRGVYFLRMRGVMFCQISYSNLKVSYVCYTE